MKKTIVVVLVTFALIILMAVLFNSLFVVDEGQYACVLRFNKIERVISDAGLHFKSPVFESVKYYSKKTLIYDIEPSDVITKDKLAMTVDFYVAWQIADPLKFFSTLGTYENAQAKLDTLTYSNVKNLMGTLNQSDIINEDDPSYRNEIYKGITENVAKAAVSYGINIKDIKIKRFDLPTDNESSVYERMISERNKIAATIIAEAEKDAAIIKANADRDYNVKISYAQFEAKKLTAEGEEEYMRILAEAFDTADKKDFFEFNRQLEVLRASLEGDEKTVILSKDSELAKLLLGLE